MKSNIGKLARLNWVFTKASYGPNVNSIAMHDTIEEAMETLDWWDRLYGKTTIKFCEKYRNALYLVIDEASYEVSFKKEKELKSFCRILFPTGKATGWVDAKDLVFI